MSTAPEIASGTPTRVINGFTTVYGVTINPMVIVLGVIVLVALLVLWRAHKTKTFDAWDLLREGGKPSWVRSVGMGAFLMTTWLIIDREIKGTLTVEWFFAYGAAWVGPILARIIKGTTTEAGAEPAKP